MDPIFATRAAIARKTFLEYGTERLSALCRAVGVADSSNQLLAAFQRILQPWGDTTIGEHPGYASNVSNDHAPFEFSLAVRQGEPDVQVYIDAKATRRISIPTCSQIVLFATSLRANSTCRWSP